MSDRKRKHGERSHDDMSRGALYWCSYCIEWHREAPCPSPDEIEKECWKIKMKWDEEETIKRAGLVPHVTKTFPILPVNDVVRFDRHVIPTPRN